MDLYKGIINKEIASAKSGRRCEIFRTGLVIRLPPAGLQEKDQTADKRVESLRVPCLDEGSTPSISTENQAIKRKIL